MRGHVRVVHLLFGVGSRFMHHVQASFGRQRPIPVAPVAAVVAAVVYVCVVKNVICNLFLPCTQGYLYGTVCLLD